MGEIDEADCRRAPDATTRSLPDVDIGWSAETLLVDTVRMARLADIVFDCAHPAALARFWAASLDGYAVAPYDDEELERLRSIGEQVGRVTVDQQWQIDTALLTVLGLE